MPLLETASEDNEPDVIGYVDFYDDIKAVEHSVTDAGVTEPFDPNYRGEVTAKDFAMQEYLGNWATNRTFERLYFTLHKVGNAALHLNPDTTYLN